jgi:hypothetical protein
MFRAAVVSLIAVACAPIVAEGQFGPLPAGFGRPQDQAVRPGIVNLPAGIVTSTDLTGLMGPTRQSTGTLWPATSIANPTGRGSQAMRLKRITMQYFAAIEYNVDGLHDYAAFAIRATAGDLADEPDSPQLVEPLEWLAALQIVVPKTGSARETAERILGIATRYGELRSEYFPFAHYLLAACDCRDGRWQSALQHTLDGLQPGMATNYRLRHLRCEILLRLGRTDEALEYARRNREECARVEGEHSQHIAIWTIQESEAVGRTEGPARRVLMLDKYAENRGRRATADGLTFGLEVQRARAYLLLGDSRTAVDLLRNATRIAEEAMPHRVPYLHLCRAYVEDFRRDRPAALRAFEAAVSQSVRLLGSEADAVRALQLRSAHFSTKPDERFGPPHFDAAGLETFLNDCGLLICQNDDQVGLWFSAWPLSLERDPFFSMKAWSAPKRVDLIRRQLGLEVEAVDPATVDAPLVGALRVIAVVPDTTAERAGIRKGDWLVAVGGRPVFSPSSIQADIEKQPPPYRLTLLRGTEKIEATVTPSAESPKPVKPSELLPQTPIVQAKPVR